MNQTRTRVALLFGGRSAEHEISIRSARSVLSALDRRRFEVILVGLGRDGAWYLHDENSFAGVKSNAAEHALARIVPALLPDGLALLDPSTGGLATASPDVVFPVLHGPYGEDGTVQGLLELSGTAYVGSGVLGSSVGMDKDVQKRLFRDSGLPIVPFVVVRQGQWPQEKQEILQAAAALGLPVFVKPANLGSSVGIRKVAEQADLDSAILHAFEYDSKVVIEKGIVAAREIECSVLGNEDPQASVPGEIVPGEEFYSYDDKYGSDSKARIVIPAQLAAEQTESVRSLAIRAFTAAECAGMARVDFLLDRNSGDLYINELNTIPGFTSISMYPKLWEASGVPYTDLITRLIDLAIERHRLRAGLRITPGR